MSFLSTSEWWLATRAAYALFQDLPVRRAGICVVIDGRHYVSADPRGVVSEARRMAEAMSTTKGAS